MNDKWAIFCPGPSLERYFFCQADFSIAVNYAILAMERADYWVLMDPEVFQYVHQKIGTIGIFEMSYALRTKLYVHWNFEAFGKNNDAGTAWSEGTFNCYRSFMKSHWQRKDDVIDAFGEVLDPYESPSGVLWNEYSEFAAIALAIKKGAKDIALYGADLKEEGYFDKDIELNWRTDHSKRRWARERWFLAHIIKECAERGIKVRRIGYKKEIGK